MSVVDVTNSNDPSFPRVLSASLIPSLTQGLDASSVLECYVLQRTALLHGLANSTVTVRKLALGLRYRPPSGGILSVSNRRRELTLEYGPLRQGSDLTHEAIPRLVMQEEDQQRYVAWENEARVYFTSKISASEYKSATYICTMTGAVLKNLLQTAVAYPSNSRRRYQPFSVYKKATNELLLKSSSDLDFVQALWQHLADVGVELAPLILPNRWQIRLIASEIKRVHVGVDGVDPTRFYLKLYNCLNSIASANYSLYDQKDMRGNRSKAPGTKKNKNSFGGRRRRSRSLDDLLMALEASDEAANNSSTFSVEPQPTRQPTLSPAPTILQTVPPLDKDDASQAAQDASQAAQDAQSAAQDAQNSGNKEAAQAAQAAAEAAQKAANATHTQAASMSQAALLGGDGAIMVQTIAQCFQNPRYGLAITNTTALAYVFFDGSSYYQVNLTTPYLQIVPINTALPESTHSSMVNDAEFVDYVLALAVFIFSMIGFLLLLQQVLGRNYQVIRPLYKFQRFLFDPMHFKHARTHDGNLLDDDSDIDARIRAHTVSLALAQNVIPLSMGGLKSVAFSKSKKNDDASESDGWGLGDGDEELDLELVENFKRSPLNSFSDPELKTVSRSPSSGNLAPLDIPKRMFRDPELVDLPSLASNSKVAMPVSFANGSNAASMLSGRRRMNSCSLSSRRAKATLCV